jgi:large subunit ribosomal protein L4
MSQNNTIDQKSATATVAANIAHVMTSQDLKLDQDARLQASPSSFAVAVRALLQNWRQGTVGYKGRSDVSRTGKKPWKQKGTGRARAGTAGSPLWRGGGACFGPQKRTKTLKISQKNKKALFNALLWKRLDEKRMVELDWSPSGERPRTSLAYKALKSAGLENKKIILFAAPHDYDIYTSFANIPNVQVLFYDQPNVYTLSYGDFWVVLKQDSEFLNKMVNAWT